MTNADCTLYLPYTVDGAVRYSRTVLRGVNWQDHWGANMDKAGAKDVSSTTVYIPAGVKADGGKTYVPPKAWEDGDKDQHWTLLRTGTATAKIIKGAVDREVTQDYPAKQLDRDFDGVRNIMAVDEKLYGSAQLQHWEVTAK